MPFLLNKIFIGFYFTKDIFPLYFHNYQVIVYIVLYIVLLIMVILNSIQRNIITYRISGNKTKINKVIDRQNRQVFVRREWVWKRREIGEGD